MRLLSLMSLLVVLISLTSGCLYIESDTFPGHPERCSSDGMFIHLSHGEDDPHRALMAFKMADIMSESQPVLLYCDIKAVSLLVEGAPVLDSPPFESSSITLEKLMSNDVTIMVCPSCLEKAGYTSEDLIDGVEIADKEEFFGFAKGRIITLDY